MPARPEGSKQTAIILRGKDGGGRGRRCFLWVKLRGQSYPAHFGTRS
jgi:hypothetical protein